jgi:hypothetical protein
MTLSEAFDTLRQFHKSALFLFFNGNTFAAIGPELSYVIFGELPMTRKREVESNPESQISNPPPPTFPCQPLKIIPKHRILHES